MEHSQVMEEDKPGFLNLLKQSLTIPFRNPNFIIFTFLTSLPLFYFLIVNEIIFQETILETVQILQERSHSSNLFINAYYKLMEVDKWIGEVSHKFLLLCLLYPGILHFLDLFNAIASVDAAALIYTENKRISLWNMICKFISETRVKGPLITSMYVLLLSSLISIGLLSLVVYVSLMPGCVPLMMLFLILFIALLAKYMEWSAIWSMGIVISVLEDKQGDVPLYISSYLSRGSRQRGLFLMLAFFVCRLALRLSCLYVGWNKGGSGLAVIIVHINFVCMGNMLKWLIFVVHFYDCKSRSLKKVVDEEEGKSSKVVT